MFDCHVHRIPIIDRIHVPPSLYISSRPGRESDRRGELPEHPALPGGLLLGPSEQLQLLDPRIERRFLRSSLGRPRRRASLRGFAHRTIPQRVVLRIMESHVISSVPVIDADRWLH